LNQCLPGKVSGEPPIRRHGADQDAEVGLDVMNGQLDAHQMLGRIHEIGKSNGYCRDAHQAVQNGDEFRHLGHLHTMSRQQSDATADHQGCQQDLVMLRDDTQHRRDQGDRHAADAVPVAAPGRFLVRKSA